MTWLSTIFFALMWAALLLGAGMLVGSWLSGLVRSALDRQRVDPEVRELLASLVRPLVTTVAVVAALESLGVDLRAVIALIVVAGLTLGAAVWQTLANAASGALLFNLRPFRLGDLVDVAGLHGTVVHIGWFATTLKQPNGDVITVTNRLITAAPVITHPRADG